VPCICGFPTDSVHQDDFLPCGCIPFDVFPPVGSHLIPRLPAFGFRCLLSVSHALKAFLRPPAAGLIPCRSRPWGSTLQGSVPPAEPCALSSAHALLQLACVRRNCSGLSDDPGPLGSTLAGQAIHTRPTISDQRSHKHAPFQGFAPREHPYHRKAV
jgi:hypothetical protein